MLFFLLVSVLGSCASVTLWCRLPFLPQPHNNAVASTFELFYRMRIIPRGTVRGSWAFHSDEHLTWMKPIGSHATQHVFRWFTGGPQLLLVLSAQAS